MPLINSVLCCNALVPDSLSACVINTTWGLPKQLGGVIPRLHDRANIEQTSSRPDETPPSGSNVGLGLAHS